MNALAEGVKTLHLPANHATRLDRMPVTSVGAPAENARYFVGLLSDFKTGGAPCP